MSRCLSGELDDAARVSGASVARTYASIAMPLIGPVLIVVAAQRFLFAANQSSTIILLASSETRRCRC